jgi:chemotaxis methyl-accepting protein methylase
MCEGYKEHCLRRRIAVRMRARGTHTYREYGELLQHDEGEHRKLLDAVTINVSKFFRNSEVWRVIDAAVWPVLFDLQVPRVRVWSAGCASGEEPYTIVMAMKDYAQRNKREKELSRFDVVGTDIDRDCLAHAKVARYGAFAFTDIDADMRRAWFTGPELNEVTPEIRSMVRFGTKDLIKDEFDSGWHMILCRNVIIYFERAVQEKLFLKFYEALAPGGFLVLGKVETIFGRASTLFKPVSQRERVFYKP